MLVNFLITLLIIWGIVAVASWLYALAVAPMFGFRGHAPVAIADILFTALFIALVIAAIHALGFWDKFVVMKTY